MIIVIIIRIIIIIIAKIDLKIELRPGSELVISIYVVNFKIELRLQSNLNTEFCNLWNKLCYKQKHVHLGFRILKVLKSIEIWRSV